MVIQQRALLQYLVKIVLKMCILALYTIIQYKYLHLLHINIKLIYKQNKLLQSSPAIIIQMHKQDNLTKFKI